MCSCVCEAVYVVFMCVWCVGGTQAQMDGGSQMMPTGSG